MDVNFLVHFLVLLVTAVIVAIAYGIPGLFAAKLAGKPFELNRFIATVLYAVVVAVIGVLTGIVTLTNISLSIFDPIWYEYIGVLYVFQKFVDAILDRFGWKPATFIAKIMHSGGY
jgi:energy-converting hydrogenase Eha subunit A